MKILKIIKGIGILTYVLIILFSALFVIMIGFSYFLILDLDNWSIIFETIPSESKIYLAIMFIITGFVSVLSTIIPIIMKVTEKK